MLLYCPFPGSTLARPTAENSFEIHHKWDNANSPAGHQRQSPWLFYLVDRRAQSHTYNHIQHSDIGKSLLVVT